MSNREELTRLSLLTLSFTLNNTTNNQGDHCIVAKNFDQKSKPIISNQIIGTEEDKCNNKAIKLKFLAEVLGLTKFEITK